VQVNRRWPALPRSPPPSACGRSDRSFLALSPTAPLEWAIGERHCLGLVPELPVGARAPFVGIEPLAALFQEERDVGPLALVAQ